MDAASARSAIFREGRGVSFPRGQVALLLLLFGVGSALILATIQQATFNSVFLLGFVSVGGLVLCRNTQIRLKEPYLKILGYFWLIKLGLTIFLLYVGWMPQLDDTSSSTWGYDPQRYYIQAQDLVDNNWSTDLLNLNYVGILYYYGAMFYLFGHNPVIPALINAFVTLLGTLYLIRLAYEFKGERGPRNWTIAYLLLIPEVLWYDVMTSRETLVAVLILVSALAAGRYIARSSQVSLSSVFLIAGTCLGAILAVRTSMAIPVVVSVTLMVILIKPRKGLGFVPKILILIAGILLLAAGPLVQILTGGYEIDYFKTISSLQSFDENVAAQMQWSENSIGMLFAPNNAWQSLLYLPPRMVLYLAAPLPNIAVSVPDLLTGSWSAWQHLMTMPSSVLNLLALPYALAGFALAWRRRRELPAPLVLHLTFWMVFMTIAGGNIITHERYRLMMTLLFFACAWLGYTSCTRNQVRKFSLPWLCLLVAGGLFFLIYKTL